MNTPDIITHQEETAKNANKAEAISESMPNNNKDWLPRSKPVRSVDPDLQHLINRKGSMFAGWR